MIHATTALALRKLTDDYRRVYSTIEQINIGADSKGHNLPEPSATKIEALIHELRSLGYMLTLKSNLKRLTEVSNENTAPPTA